MNFGIEVTDGDLTFTGKKFVFLICEQNQIIFQALLYLQQGSEAVFRFEQQYHWVRKYLTNKIIDLHFRYRAYARRDISFTVAIKLSIEPNNLPNSTTNSFF